MTTSLTDTVSLIDLPEVGQPLGNGIFAGLTTHAGQHCAIVLLADKPPTRLPWRKAMDWAESVGGQLPTRPMAAQLFAAVRTHLDPSWHWTADMDGASYAWSCYFTNGHQFSHHKSAEGGARAVRLIPIAA